VIVGEADESFPDFLYAVRDGRDPASVAGVVRKTNTGITSLRPRSPFKRLDHLPTPDYRDYFDRIQMLGVPRYFTANRPQLPFESSRGCWWGEKHHCTFCGLNNSGMAHRAKTATRVIQELTELARPRRENEASRRPVR